MTFEELLMVIDPNADGGEILELEFRGNEEYNRVRSDCVEILEPLFEYQVNSIGINDNGEQRIWLDPPKRADTPLTDCETCKYGQELHRYAHICNECGVGINNYTPQTETQIETQNSNLTFEKSDCPWK